MADLDLARVEEAGLNALQTQHQLFFDGWLLRVSPGTAKRARSVNAHFGSTLPLDAKIAHCEALYEARGLPALFRMTPFQQPADLDAVLERRGYSAFGRTLVQAIELAAPPSDDGVADVALDTPPIAEFVDAVGELRASSAEQRAAHFERLGSTPLTTHAVIARVDGRPAACGGAAPAGLRRYERGPRRGVRGRAAARPDRGAREPGLLRRGAGRAGGRGRAGRRGVG